MWGYELLTDTYQNSTCRLMIKDYDGYLYFVSYRDLADNAKRKRVLEKFYPTNPFTIHNIHLWLKLNNIPYKLLSTEYIDNSTYLQWQCLKPGCGEKFEAIWANLQFGFGCPYCSVPAKKVGLSNCLATKNPELAKEWHPTKNGDLTPYNVLPGSGEYVWWQCKENPKHEWYAVIAGRTSNRDKRGCPYCSSHPLPSEDYNLAVSHPNLVSEWDYNKNDKIPEDYTPKSSQKVSWKCKKGHEWEAFIVNRTKKNYGCPYCSGRLPSEEHNLLIDNSELCKEWDYNKNTKTPKDYTPMSGYKVWWQCSECGYSWNAAINERNRKDGKASGCPECAESHGEIKIRERLRQKNIVFEPQKTFEGLIGLGGGLLSYDFYTPKYRLLIEFQGEQHQRFVKGIHKTKKDFERQLEHDRRKKNYALSNGYNFLEIWYYDFDNIETILTQTLEQLSKNDSCFSFQESEVTPTWQILMFHLRQW